MSEHNLISSMQAALKEAAEDIPEDTNLFPRIRQHLLSEHASMYRSTPFWQKRRLSLVSGLLVAAVLLFSGFTFVLPALFNWLGDPSLQQITIDHATTINRQVTVHGITLHLDQAYADAARTAITFHMVSSSKVAPHPFPPVLTDEHNQINRYIVGQQFRSQALVEFAPLAPDVLNHRHTLTFTIRTMIIQNTTSVSEPIQNTTSASEPTLDGIWSITFQLQPLIDHSVRLTNPPLVHHGLAIKPLQLDFAPSGARLLIQINGLAPDTSQDTVAKFMTLIQINGLSPDLISTSSGLSSGGAFLQLRLPDGRILVPAMVQPWDSTADAAIIPTTHERAVGANGKVIIQVLFFTTLPTSQKAATLTIDQLYNSPVSAENYTTVTGPWTFPISLQKS